MKFTFVNFNIEYLLAAGFYSLRIRKKNVNNAKSVSESKIVYVSHLMGEIDDENLLEELEICKLFLVNSEMENAKDGL